MNKDNLKKFRTRLVRAIDAHLKRGGTLITGGFYVGNPESQTGSFCPLQCYFKVDQIPDKLPYYKAFTKKLGFKLQEEEMWDFIYGFDNAGLVHKETMEMPLYLLGQSLRKKYQVAIDKGNK